jgi:hypothetical protein
VLVDEIDIEDVSMFETEDDPPVAGDGHTPDACQITGERVQSPPRKNASIAKLPGPVEDRQDASDLRDKIGWNTVLTTTAGRPLCRKLAMAMPHETVSAANGVPAAEKSHILARG